MKKSTISIILILVILVISMSFLFVGCKNTSTDPIIGKFTYAGEIKGNEGRYYEFFADFSFSDNGTVNDEVKWQYNKDKKCYEIVHVPTNVTVKNFELINNNTLQEKYKSNPTPYTRVS